MYDEDYFGEWDVIPLTNKPITFVTLRGGMLPNLYDTGFSVVGLSQQGNALATVFRYGEGGGSPESMQATLDEAEAALTPIADQLCAFSAEGCE